MKTRGAVALFIAFCLTMILVPSIARASGMLMINRASSMAPAFKEGQVLEISPTDQPPRRWDVVLFRYKLKDEENVAIKRVVGLPGERLELKGPSVWINGKKIPSAQVGSLKEGQIFEENHRHQILWDPAAPAQSVPGVSLKVPSGKYFLLGDNRTASLDSRALGAIEGAQIEGIVTGTVNIEPAIRDSYRPVPCRIEISTPSSEVKKMAIDLDKPAKDIESLIDQVIDVLYETKVGTRTVAALTGLIKKRPDFRIVPLTQDLRNSSRGFFPDDTLGDLGGAYFPVFIETSSKQQVSVLAIDPTLPVGLATINYVHEAVHALDATFNAMARKLAKHPSTEGVISKELAAKNARIILDSERKAYDVAYETMEELESRFACFKSFRQWAGLRRKAITYRPSNRQIAKWYGLSVPSSHE